MENVADALRMAFAVIVFVIAMAIALSLLSQANATTTQIFYSMDTITYLDKSPVAGEAANHRIVGLETIIPTIYRYPVENCGVTIVRKKDGKYELIARYDVETENIASQIANVLEFDKNIDTSTERYKEAARIYYSHINYLVTNLKITGDDSLFPVDDEVTVNNITYASNDNLKERINVLYKYYPTENRDDDTVYYGAAWGTDYVAERLKSDFSGDKLVEIDNKFYDVEDYGDVDDLLSYLEGKSFKEYIIEVDTTYDIINYEEEFGGGTQENSSKNTTKLEIIYVEYVEQ